MTPVRAALVLLAAGASCAKADGGFDGGPAHSDGALLPDGAPVVRADAGPDAEPHGDATPVINEFVADHVSFDTCEYVEIAGAAGTDYGRYTVLTVEGDSGGPGQVQAVIPVGTTSAGGLWVSAFMSDQLQNGTMTILLVEDFAGGTPDLDTDDDGVFDSEPWANLADAVAVHDGDLGDHTYAATAALVESYDGEDARVGGASRIPDASDTDQPTDWVRNLDNAAGLTCESGAAGHGEARNTPGAANSI